MLLQDAFLNSAMARNSTALSTSSSQSDLPSIYVTSTNTDLLCSSTLQNLRMLDQSLFFVEAGATKLYFQCTKHQAFEILRGGPQLYKTGNGMQRSLIQKHQSNLAEDKVHCSFILFYSMFFINLKIFHNSDLAYILCAFLASIRTNRL